MDPILISPMSGESLKKLKSKGKLVDHTYKYKDHVSYKYELKTPSGLNIVIQKNDAYTGGHEEDLWECFLTLATFTGGTCGWLNEAEVLDYIDTLEQFHKVIGENAFKNELWKQGQFGYQYIQRVKKNLELSAACKV